MQVCLTCIFAYQNNCIDLIKYFYWYYIYNFYLKRFYLLLLKVVTIFKILIISHFPTPDLFFRETSMVNLVHDLVNGKKFDIIQINFCFLIYILNDNQKYRKKSYLANHWYNDKWLNCNKENTVRRAGIKQFSVFVRSKKRLLDWLQIVLRCHISSI